MNVADTVTSLWAPCTWIGCPATPRCSRTFSSESSQITARCHAAKAHESGPGILLAKLDNPHTLSKQHLARSTFDLGHTKPGLALCQSRLEGSNGMDHTVKSRLMRNRVCTCNVCKEHKKHKKNSSKTFKGNKSGHHLSWAGHLGCFMKDAVRICACRVGCVHLAVIRIHVGDPLRRIRKFRQSSAFKPNMNGTCGIVREGLPLFSAWETNSIQLDSSAQDECRIQKNPAGSRTVVRGAKEVITVVTVAVAAAFMNKLPGTVHNS